MVTRVRVSIIEITQQIVQIVAAVRGGVQAVHLVNVVHVVSSPSGSVEDVMQRRVLSSLVGVHLGLDLDLGRRGQLQATNLSDLLSRLALVLAGLNAVAVRCLNEVIETELAGGNGAKEVVNRVDLDTEILVTRVGGDREAVPDASTVVNGSVTLLAGDLEQDVQGRAVGLLDGIDLLDRDLVLVRRRGRSRVAARGVGACDSMSALLTR